MAIRRSLVRCRKDLHFSWYAVRAGLRPRAGLHDNHYYGIVSAAIVVGPYSSGRVLIATSRPSFVSLARHTSPIPPLPKSVEIS